MSDSKIIEAHGQFLVVLEKGVEMFGTEAEAAAALSQFENGAEHRDLAQRYCDYKGIEGAKNAKGKINILTDFLAWVDAGTPPPAEKTEDEAADEAADVAVETSTEDSSEKPVEF